MIKLTVRKNWGKLDKDFAKWYKSNRLPDWRLQKKWLETELIKRKFVSEDDADRMWVIFSELTENCSDWKFQTKILSLVTLCLQYHEDLASKVK